MLALIIMKYIYDTFRDQNLEHDRLTPGKSTTGCILMLRATVECNSLLSSQLLVAYFYLKKAFQLVYCKSIKAYVVALIVLQSGCLAHDSVLADQEVHRGHEVT